MTDRSTYRITFTRVINDSVDIRADGPGEALEGFWEYAHRCLRDGNVVSVSVESRRPEQGPDQGAG